MNAVREAFLDLPSECLGERRIPPDVRPSVSGLRTSTPFRHQIVQLQSCQTGAGPEFLALWYNWGMSLSQSRSQAPNTQSAPSAPSFTSPRNSRQCQREWWPNMTWSMPLGFFSCLQLSWATLYITAFVSPLPCLYHVVFFLQEGK